MSLFGGLFSGDPPIVPTLPAYQRQFDSKWSNLAPMIGQSNVSPDIAQSIYALDRRRILSGQAPLSSPDTARALLSANQGHTVTPSPTRSMSPFAFAGNAVHDIRNITQSLFKLPGALVNEVEQVPNIPGAVSNALATASNPAEAVTNLTQVPGIRMIPGSYDVGQLARGPSGWRELLTHPVFTALDALPAASKLAEATRVAEAAREASVLAKAGELPNEISPASATTRPLKALAFNTLNDEGAIVRNSLGQLVDAAARSDAGTWARSAFAPGARAASVIKSYWDSALQQSMVPGLRLPERFAAVQDLVAITRDTELLKKQFPEIADPAWSRETHDMMTTGQWADMTPRQVAYSGAIRDLGERLASYSAARGDLAKLDGEWYPAKDAARITAARNAATYSREMTDIRTHMLAPTEDVQTYLDLTQQELNRADLAGNIRRQRATAYLRAAEGMGADLGDTFARLRNTPLDQHPSFNLPANPPITPLAPISDLLSTLAPYRDWTRVGELKATLANGEWGQASGIIRDMERQAAKVPGAADYLPTLDHLHDRARLEPGFSAYTEKATLAKEAAAEKLAASISPARYGPLIEHAAEQTVINKASSPADITRITQALVQHNYASIADVLPGGADDLSRMAESISETWQDLKAAGLDPVFVHRVAPESIARSNFPKVSDVLRTPTSIKARTWDFAPYMHDAQVAMQQAGLELLQRYGSEAFIGDIIETFGKSRSDVEALMRERAITRSLVGDPRFANYETSLADLTRHEWKPFNPEFEGYFWSSQKLKDLAEGDWMLPRYIAENIERWHNPRTTRVQALLDPIMGTFRTALLPFNPAWHIHSIVGGGVALSAEVGPQALFKYWREAWDMMRSGEVPEGMALARRSNEGLYQEIQIAEGRSLGRWMSEAESHRLNTLGQRIEHPGDLMAVARDKFGKVRDASYTFNGMIHEFYRSVAYLTGEEKSGLVGREAEMAGVELANKILPHFSELTPIERQVMRYVFPFYGWLNYLARYALRYPFDHPIRTSIMAQVSRNALQDLGQDGLPESFLTVNFFGSKRADGSQNGWRTNSINPFSSLASRFTLVGLMSATNPVLSAVVDNLGVTKGHIDAYPNLAFDPQTGRLGATSPGLLQSFVGHLIPQSAIFTALAGVNANFKDLVRRDPEAARRMLEQAGGIPIPVIAYNQAQEIAKREIAVHTGQQQAKHAALIGGNLSSPYPGLDPFFRQVSELAPDQLAQFTPSPAALPPQLSSLMPGTLSGRASAGGV